jgi:putative ABC transport system permease protein
MAARDSARNRTRTVPAVAAVLAAATLASVAMVLAASQLEDAKRTHYWSAHQFQAVLPLTMPGPPVAASLAAGPPVAEEAQDRLAPDSRAVDQAALSAVVRQSLETVEWTQPLAGLVAPRCDMRATATGALISGDDPSGCLKYGLGTPASNECPATLQGRIKDASDWRCMGSMFPAGISGQLPQLIVGGADELRAVLGREPGQESLNVLANGGIVVSNPVYVQDGQATLEATDTRKPRRAVGPAFQGYEVVSSTRLPAVVEVPIAPVPYYGVISAQTADSLGLTAEPAALVVQLAGLPGNGEQDKVSAALSTFYGVPGMSLSVEHGIGADSSALLWIIVGLSALITLSAAGITTGLALADARNDHMTLAAVGAAPGLRRSLAAAQSLMTAGLGTLLGIAAGVVPAALTVAATRMYAGATIPWLQFLALLVAVPLTGSALAWMFTKARLPMSRRGAGG